MVIGEGSVCPRGLAPSPGGDHQAVSSYGTALGNAGALLDKEQELGLGMGGAALQDWSIDHSSHTLWDSPGGSFWLWPEDHSTQGSWGLLGIWEASRD